jgi:murein DD-endopeptidase MepM/ murein hydrolase activator NlpD
MALVYPSTSFHQRLISVNGLDMVGFGQWLFHPGMLFGSHTKWWGDMGRRNRPHEGLDFHAYRTATGEVRHLDATTRVPAMFEGEIAHVIGDFLGQSLFLRHDAQNDGSRLYSVYGHVTPLRGVRAGKKVAEGEIVGTIAGAGGKGRATPSHFHFSVAWVPDTMPPDTLDWQVMIDPDGVVLIDPLSVIECPYTIERPSAPQSKIGNVETQGL